METSTEHNRASDSAFAAKARLERLERDFAEAARQPDAQAGMFALVEAYIMETPLADMMAALVDETYGDWNFRSLKKRLWAERLQGIPLHKKITRIIGLVLIRPIKPLAVRLKPVWSTYPDAFFSKPLFRFVYDDMIAELQGYFTLLKQNIAVYRDLFDRFGDAASRNTLLYTMMARMTLNDRYYADCMSHETQYFCSDLLPSREREVFVDAGGFIGDTALSYEMRYGFDCVQRYYLFEPDPDNFQSAVANLRHLKNISFINAGVSDHRDLVGFRAVKLGSSAIAEDGGNVSVEITTIDERVPERVTFIKMDVEGFELAALRGAQEHIKRDRPVLAICVYHKPEDMVEIPAFILRCNPDYRLYLRHHTSCSYETVLYAI